MIKDDRPKALMAFNFANLDFVQLEYVKLKLSKKYPEHLIFTDGKEWRNDRFKYNYFCLTIEPSVQGNTLICYHGKPVLVITEKEFTFGAS